MGSPERTVGLLLAFLWLAPVAAQQRSPVGELAKRQRDARQAGPRAKQVWTNDNLPGRPGAASVAGPLAAPAGEPVPGEAAAEDPREKERNQIEAALDAERKSLLEAKKDLDLLQRDADLARQDVSAHPNYGANPRRAGQARLDDYAGRIQAQRETVEQIRQRIAELEEKLEGLNRTLGPKKQKPLTPDEQREVWTARVRSLRAELERVDAELARLRREASAAGSSLYGVTDGGSLTAQMLADLEKRRSQLLQQMAEVEEEARRAGVPPAWLREP